MKKATPALFATAALLAACGEKPAPPPEAPPAAGPDLGIVIGEKVGLITAANCTREAVLAAYGNDAKVDSLYIIDGMYGEGVVLFPDQPRRRAEIYWSVENDPKRPLYIRIEGDSTGATDWKTAEGITIGTPMATIEQMNGKPFSFSGFGWDYGGFVSDWKGGKFNASFSPRFDAGSTDPTAIGKVSGEGVHESNSPDVAAAKPIVTSLSFRFLANEKLPDCIAALVKADKVEAKMVVLKTNVGGTDHYWLQSGAAAYDGIEHIYDANCKEVCQSGGMRVPPPCMKVYEGKQWEVVWEEQ
jgi:hypothetical protein